MSLNFADKLIASILEKQSQVCVGLDPRVEKLPSFLRERYEGQAGLDAPRAVAACFEEFCGEIIEAVAPHAVAVKLQLACFEQYGPPGLEAFEHLCRRAAEAGLIVIADAKRGDIGISAQAYSAAFIGRPAGFNGSLEGYGADALTVNPLFGSDGLKPFLEDCEAFAKGIFVLVKTSNPGSAELQDLLVDGSPFYERVANLVATWGQGLVGKEGYSSVGAVVGATQAAALATLRQLLPQTFLLLPGFGAQGAGVDDVLAAFDTRGLGALITASRSIIYADGSPDFASTAKESARQMQKQLWQASH